MVQLGWGQEVVSHLGNTINSVWWGCGLIPHMNSFLCDYRMGTQTYQELLGAPEGEIAAPGTRFTG